MIKLVECPRDAMQGLNEFIPTNYKVAYINQLLQVGFDTIDFGSFVSPKSIPQMKDTADVLKRLNLSSAKSKLLAIIANKKGAEDACSFDEIAYLGFPFSISDTFQRRNTNSSIEESLARVEEILDLCALSKKQLVVYLSMAFGNPYGDTWNFDVAMKWTSKLHSMGVGIIALADTIGVSTPENIRMLFGHLIPEFKSVEFGAHLHSRKETAREKIQAAYESGCRRFDSAIHGLGGCPMAKDDLTGNIATEELLSFLQSVDQPTNLDEDQLKVSMDEAWKIFPH